MLLTEQIVEQIGNNVIMSVIDPIKGLIPECLNDRWIYRATDGELNKIADNIKNAIGPAFDVSVSELSYRGLKSLTIFDNDGVGFVWWDFFITDGM